MVIFLINIENMALVERRGEYNNKSEMSSGLCNFLGTTNPFSKNFHYERVLENS